MTPPTGRPSFDREIGELDIRMDRVERDIELMSVDVKTILSKLSEMKGSGKTLLLMGSVAAAIGGIAGAVAPFLFTHVK